MSEREARSSGFLRIIASLQLYLLNRHLTSISNKFSKTHQKRAIAFERRPKDL